MLITSSTFTQNQVQLEKFQLQELRSRHQEEIDKLSEDFKQQNATFELQKVTSTIAFVNVLSIS